MTPSPGRSAIRKRCADRQRMTEPLHISPEVADALRAGRPVVALESTLITHGLPYPANVETALAMEAAVRAGGAVPATIAVLAGKITVGLARADLERLAARAAGRGGQG